MILNKLVLLALPVLTGLSSAYDVDGYKVLETTPYRMNTTIDDPSSKILPAGYIKSSGSRALPNATRFEHNQVYETRDGKKLRVDIFRPVTDDPVPAILMWSPYGKSSTGPLNLGSAALRAGVAKSKLSGFQSFEGLDPAEWVARGYAVINADSRGSGDSEGDIRFWGSGDGKDGYDLIEQLAKEPWCTGKVATAGNSWLAVSQWFIASEQPPHLAAIAPLEGLGDVLRETVARGGILSSSFVKLIQESLPGRQMEEDVIAMYQKYPERNEYWDDKRVDYSKINVPAYILGSYSTNLHTQGAFRGFDEITHSKKWLTTHHTQEWYDLYSEQRIEDLDRFFKFYLMGVQNGWEETAPVRLAMLGYNLPNQNFSLPDIPWSNPGSKQLRLHINPDQTMTEAIPAGMNQTGVLSYQADAPCMSRDSDTGELYFNYTFTKKTFVAGPSKVTINLSAQKQNDLDVYAMLRKADANGNILQSINQPLSDLGVRNASQVPSVSILKYLGPEGMLRASLRAISNEISKPWRPTQALVYSAGDVVQLEISLWPTGMIFEAGEKLILKLAGHDMRLVDFAQLQGSFNVTNKGKHYVHFAEAYPNMLELNIL
ncbi:alpha/beta-hydrolase [Penicillium malachiteum]|uniref:alpha/beta-hydrolase n=1 Tax=Penicillium malachiteum TaxID=1324776 RepID=UPI0025490359|nr:alpha/beta-hydrolase [Penicillium malachiteum]KAJ5725008.1 alpha/beta-hydrolase [Penicillium malachiteum]